MSFFSIRAAFPLLFIVPLVIHKAVADTSLGQNIAGSAGSFSHLLPQIINIQPDVMRLVPVFIAPDLGKDLVVSEHPSGIPDKVIQQPVFGGPQFDQFSIHPHFPAAKVDSEAGHPRRSHLLHHLQKLPRDAKQPLHG